LRGAGAQPAQVVGIEARAAVGQYGRQRAHGAAADAPRHAEEFGHRDAAGAQRRKLLGGLFDENGAVGADDGAACALVHRPPLALVPGQRTGHHAPAHHGDAVGRALVRAIAHRHDHRVGPAQRAHGVGEVLQDVPRRVGQRLRQPRQHTGFRRPVVRGHVRRAFAQYGFHDLVVADSDRCVRCRVGHGFWIIGCLRPATPDYLTIRSVPIEFQSCPPCLTNLKISRSAANDIVARPPNKGI
jgi:hypothetical protein